MAKQVQEIQNPMEVIKFSLVRQQEQGAALVKIIDHVEQIESNVEFKFAEMNSMVQEVRDSVTLTYEEQRELQSHVFSNSISFAKESLAGEKVSNEEFSKLVGKFRRAIWKKLKEHMNVPRYSSIRRIDFKKSLAFVDDLRMKDFLEV